jgi:hypothetical protein
MNPRLVWDVWRRTLADEKLSAAVLEGRLGDIASQFSPAELAVLEDYAKTTTATKITVDMFRGRLAVTIPGTLIQVAPYTKVLLDKLGEDRVKPLVKAFITAIEYRDDGPRFCRTGLDLLQFLATRAPFAEVPGWAEIAQLESASLRLQLRLGRERDWREPPGCDPEFDRDAGETFADYDAWALVSSGNGETVRLDHDVTPWLEQPETLGDTVLFPGPTWWLASLANVDSTVEYSQLSERAFRIFGLLEHPLRPTEIGARVPDIPELEVLGVLGDLLDLGIIRAIRA